MIDFPGQSQNAGEKAVDAVLQEFARLDELTSALQSNKAKLRNATKQLAACTNDEDARAQEGQHDALRDETDSVHRQVNLQMVHAKDKARELGTEDRRRVQGMWTNPHVRARINGRSLRENIRATVVTHKFEREKLNGSLRNYVLRKSMDIIRSSCMLKRCVCEPRKQRPHAGKGCRSSTGEEHQYNGS